MSTKVVFEVGMTCGGCSNACKRILSKQPGVKEVSADLDTKLVVAMGEGMDSQAQLAALQKWATASGKSLKLLSASGAQAAPAPAPAGAAFSFEGLVGKSGTEAKALTEAAHPGKQVQVVPADSMVTMDFRQDRIRIFVDGDGNVARAPSVG